MMDATTTKRGAALASVGSGALLTVLKLAVGIATGSLAILAEALHSALDLLAAGLTFLVVHIADLPPDENHPLDPPKVLDDQRPLTAFWVNAYNALFLKAIVDAYPIGSVNDIKDLDTAKTRVVAGKPYSFAEMRVINVKKHTSMVVITNSRLTARETGRLT